MRLREILLDAIINTKLFEMAYQRKIAIDKVRSRQDTIALHLVKLLMFSNNNVVPHWKTEVNSWISELNRIKLKPYNHRLYSDNFMQLLFDEPLGTSTDTYDFIKEVYRLHNQIPPSNINPEQVNKALALIYKSISDDLAIGNFTHIDNYL